ncbi:MAG: pyocin activator PrtN family protein [Colwellia sp.]|nr:pyocin activator PrtN family protein [Colwellia sp.]
MNTNFALLARFETPVIELKQVCEEFFGIKPKTAEQKVKGCDFPIPTFKLRDSERSPTLIKIEDLANYIDKRYAEAEIEWKQVHNL